MKKPLKITLAVFLSAILFLGILCMFLFIPLKGEKHDEFWSYKQEFNINDIAVINKTPGKDLKILQLTDIQLWSFTFDNKAALDLVKTTIKNTSPDLIVLTGDNVSGLATNLYVRDLIKVMESFNIPWAPIFGNHDGEGKATQNWQGDRFLEAKNCLFKKGPTNLYGLGNYVVNIKEGDNIVNSLFFFDNGKYIKYPDGSKVEPYMTYAQIAWYKWNVEGIAKAQKSVVPSMTFSHCAIPEFQTAIKELARKDADGRYYVPEELGFGSCSYLPAAAPINSGFFDVAKANGTKQMFFGHDHENDASITYQGVTMTYGLKAGKSPRFWNNATEYGGTLITLDAANTVTIEHKAYEKA